MYSITVNGVSATTGPRPSEIVPNAVLESEELGGASDDSFGTAQNLDSALTSLGSGGSCGRDRHGRFVLGHETEPNNAIVPNDASPIFSALLRQSLSTGYHRKRRSHT